MKGSKMVGSRLQCCLWLAMVIRARGELTHEIAQRELGISRRTYFRCLQDLREAGLIFESFNRRIDGVRFIAFDEVLAPVRVSEVA